MSNIESWEINVNKKMYPLITCLLIHKHFKRWHQVSHLCLHFLPTPAEGTAPPIFYLVCLFHLSQSEEMLEFFPSFLGKKIKPKKYLLFGEIWHWYTLGQPGGTVSWNGDDVMTRPSTWQPPEKKIAPGPISCLQIFFLFFFWNQNSPHLGLVEPPMNYSMSTKVRQFKEFTNK